MELEQETTFKSGITMDNGMVKIVIIIDRPITKKNLEIAINTLNEHIFNFFKDKKSSTECMVEYRLDSIGGDLDCFFIFNDYMNEMKQKYPNLKFSSIPIYTDCVASLLYMLADERIVIPDSVSPMMEAKTSSCSLKFSSIFPASDKNDTVTKARNDICRILFNKGFKLDMVNLCLPKEEKDELQYCGDIIHMDGFANKLVEAK